MSFNSRFKHIFGEIFQSEGFKYCSKLNVFAKMLNEDLLAFIGVKSAPIWNKGSKGFMITAGIISTYYDSIEKNSVLMIGHDLNLFLPKNEVRVSFEYDDNTMEEIILITALYVREQLLPVINQVFDFNSYIEYLKKYSIDLLWNCDSFKGESLILIKADNHDDFQNFSSNSWMNYTHELMLEMWVMVIRKKWHIMIYSMVLLNLLFILVIKYILTIYTMKH